MLSPREYLKSFTHEYKTIGTLNDVKKQTCLAVSIYRVFMIILVNWVTDFRPPKFHKSSVLTPCFQILDKTLIVVNHLMSLEAKAVGLNIICFL